MGDENGLQLFKGVSFKPRSCFPAFLRKARRAEGVETFALCFVLCVLCGALFRRGPAE